MAKRSPKPVDTIVGQNIRIFRLQRGLSQTELGQKIGVTFQQVQKYEKGANRVGGSRMYQIAEVLGITIAQLFDGAQPGKGAAPAPVDTPRELLADPHTLRLVQAFDAVGDDKQKLAVLHLVEAMVPVRAAKRKAA